MRTQAGLKAATLLTFIPTGAPIGWFVATKIDVDPRLFGRSGETRAANVGIQIREAPADRRDVARRPRL